MRLLAAACILALGLTHGAASACGYRPEQWYKDVSDVIFEGVASCDATERSCKIKVTKILKNPMNLSITNEPIVIDYYSWYADPSNVGPGEIVLACGVPVFEPDLRNFRGRFYANRDPRSLELRVRRHLVRSSERRLRSPYDCADIDGKIVCKEDE
jgi:hypothetical protein